MKTDFYSLTPEERGKCMQLLAEEALKHWDLEGTEMTLIMMRENAIFRVENPGGERYALRVHRYNYHSDESLHSELQWVRALSESGINLPSTIPTVNGDLFCRVQSPFVPEPRQVDLCDWIDGRSMADVLAEKSDPKVIIEAMKSIGQLAARIHNHATSWQLPEGFVRHAWDAEGIAGDQPFWGRFWELPDLTLSQRALIIKARDKLYADLLDYGARRETYSLIHADLLPENILIENGIIRIIDFDDAGFGWHQFELATVLMSYYGGNYFDKLKDALISGYRCERKLPDDALLILPSFFLARALTWLGWSLTRYETETAQRTRPHVIVLACGLAEDYLSGN
jgi:Ser/Thr protein kinase RdoA (MazF antagonist)